MLNEHSSARCGDTVVVQIERMLVNRHILTNACSIRRGDTTHFVYRDATGHTIVAGLTFRVPPEHIRGTLDSLHGAFEARYGSSSRCPYFRSAAPDAVGRFDWDLDSLVLTLWGYSITTLHEVSIEARASEKLCDEPVGEPTVR
jgi:hypothetical protein